MLSDSLWQLSSQSTIKNNMILVYSDISCYFTAPHITPPTHKPTNSCNSILDSYLASTNVKKTSTAGKVRNEGVVVVLGGIWHMAD